VLLPTLFVTISLGVIFWLWLVSSYVVFMWLKSVVYGSGGDKEVTVVKKDGVTPSAKLEPVQTNGNGKGSGFQHPLVKKGDHFEKQANDNGVQPPVNSVKLGEV
jgi:hypothetical protein